jgi:hypothetical protein
MNKLKAITTKAKALYKSGKYSKWTDAIKAAAKTLPATKKATIMKKEKISGLDKVIRKGKKTNVQYSRINSIGSTIDKLLRQYIAVYTYSNGGSDYEIFKAHSLQEAKKLANFHKRINGIKAKVSVKLIKKTA